MIEPNGFLQVIVKWWAQPLTLRFFSDFDLCHVTEAGKVENYRFLKNVT